MNHHSAGQHRVLVQIGTVAFASHWRHLKRVVMTGDPLGGASVARGRVGMSVVFFGGRSEPRRPMARVSMDWSGSGGDGNCPVSSPDGQCERTPSPPPEHRETTGATRWPSRWPADGSCWPIDGGGAFGCRPVFRPSGTGESAGEHAFPICNLGHLTMVSH